VSPTERTLPRGKSGIQVQDAVLLKITEADGRQAARQQPGASTAIIDRLAIRGPKPRARSARSFYCARLLLRARHTEHRALVDGVHVTNRRA